MSERNQPKYPFTDFSARAIQYRFESGYWNSDDVIYVVEVLFKLEAYGQVTTSMAEDLANRRREFIERRKQLEANRGKSV
jgi:hypothetical protein